MYSFIVNTISPKKIANLEKNLKKVMHSTRWELICIHDAKSMCEGYNRGMAIAKGTFFIFCHEDMEFIAEDITTPLELAFENSDVFGVMGTRLCLGLNFTIAGIPNVVGIWVAEKATNDFAIMASGVEGVMLNGIQSLDGVLIGAHSSVAKTLGWDQDTFDGWHGYDVDFSYRAYRAGYNVAVTCVLPIIHYCQSTFMDQDFLNAETKFFNKHDLIKNIKYDRSYENCHYGSMEYPGYGSLPEIMEDLKNNFLGIMNDCTKIRYENMLRKPKVKSIINR